MARAHACILGAGFVAISAMLEGQGFDEDFAMPPAPAWVVFGDAALFAWEPAAQALRVTWDSRRPNSYFARPLGTVLNRHDDFLLGFTLVLDQVEVGVNPGKPYTFELAVGFLNWRDATNATFLRGTGAASPNLVEFDYFPDSGYGATIWPTFVGSDGRWNYNSSEDFTRFELEAASRHRLEWHYTAADQTLRTRLWKDGAAAGPVNDVRLAPRFTDYTVDTLAVCSYSDQGAQGSLRARGWLDDIIVRVPPPPIGTVTGQFMKGEWQVRFEARTNWVYVLERSVAWGAWDGVSTGAIEQAHGPLVLADAVTFDRAFYRVRAQKP